MPIRGMRAVCWARATSGHAVAEPTIPLMKSRRRIAFLKAQDCVDFRVHLVDYSRDLRPAKWGLGSVCTAAILSRSCPLWVKSGHQRCRDRCPLYPQKRTPPECDPMSALCQKQTSGGRLLREIIDEFAAPILSAIRWQCRVIGQPVAIAGCQQGIAWE